MRTQQGGRTCETWVQTLREPVLLRHGNILLLKSVQRTAFAGLLETVALVSWKYVLLAPQI